MKKPTPEEFIRTWQTSASCKEVAAKLGMKTESVHNRAAHYRKKGIPLKEMPIGRRSFTSVYIQTLINLCNESTPNSPTSAKIKARKKAT